MRLESLKFRFFADSLFRLTISDTKIISEGYLGSVVLLIAYILYLSLMIFDVIHYNKFALTSSEHQHVSCVS
jgi:hypothetical protein